MAQRLELPTMTKNVKKVKREKGMHPLNAKVSKAAIKNIVTTSELNVLKKW